MRVLRALLCPLVGLLLTGSATAARIATPLADTTPIAVSPVGLQELARQFGVPIFWAGPMHGMQYEVRRSGGNVYLRYLPTGVPAGTTEGNFLTIVTYPFAGGYQKLAAIASYRALPIAGGGLAYVDQTHPQSIHLGFPRFGDYQVEVYDPAPSVSLRFALSGKVRPVDGAAVASENPSDAVSRWLTLAYNETGVHSLAAPRLWRSMGLVAVAVEDAVDGVPAPQAPGAAAGAAESVLGYLYPDQRQVLRAAATAAANDRTGFAFGRAVAARAIAREQSDGSARIWNGHRPTGRNAWVPTPPGNLPPIDPLAGDWRTWLLPSGHAVQPPPPPVPGSPQYRRGVNEVYTLSRHLTPSQINLALWWAADPRWPRMAIAAVSAARLAPRAAASFYGTFFATEADALVATWAAKYRYWEARPVTVIRRDLDPQWSPLVDTPAFPSYVAAHAVLSGAAAVVLGRYFPKQAAYFDRQARLCALSRIYAGIHFRFDTDAGLAMGRRIGKIGLAHGATLRQALRPLR